MGYRTDKYGRIIGTSFKGMYGTNHYDNNHIYQGRTSKQDRAGQSKCYDKGGNFTGYKNKDIFGNTVYRNKDGSKRIRRH